MFQVTLSHEAPDLIGGVEFAARDLFSAYRLTWAYIQTEGGLDSFYRIECNREAMGCKQTISIDAIKSFFLAVPVEGSAE